MFNKKVLMNEILFLVISIPLMRFKDDEIKILKRVLRIRISSQRHLTFLFNCSILLVVNYCRETLLFIELKYCALIYKS